MFRSGLFNLGAESAFLPRRARRCGGVLFCSLPGWFSLPVAILCGAVAGSFACTIPAALRLRFGASEMATSSSQLCLSCFSACSSSTMSSATRLWAEQIASLRDPAGCRFPPSARRYASQQRFDHCHSGLYRWRHLALLDALGSQYPHLQAPVLALPIILACRSRASSCVPRLSEDWVAAAVKKAGSARPSRPLCLARSAWLWLDWPCRRHSGTRKIRSCLFRPHFSLVSCRSAAIFWPAT